jgi:serine acetyltransferase
MISKMVLLVHRVGHLLDSGSVPSQVRRLLWPIYRVADLVWMKLLAGAELPHTCCIGSGLLLAHGGRGVIVGLNSKIGENVSIYQFATIGAAENRRDAWPLPVPTIEDNVRIGTGACVVGQLTIGEGAVVGPLALVTKDVPPGRTATGNPARVFF